MNRHVVTMPPELMRMLSVDWDIDWRGQPPADQTGGGSQVVYNAFPRWVGSPQIILSRGLVAKWRAVRWQAQGRVGIYRVFMNDPHVFSSSQISVNPAYVDQGVPWDSGQPWDNGQGWFFSPSVNVASDVAAGATNLIVRVPDLEYLPRVGMIMSHNDWPFGVTAVTHDGGARYRLDVQMPLRAPIPAGDPVMLIGSGLFEATEDGMGNPAYDLTGASRPQLSFREVLNR